MPLVDVHDVLINYRWDGDETNPVLILSNSLTTNLNLWEDQIADFSNHFRVLRYDNRGHGGSSSPPGEYSLDDIGNDILLVMDHLEVERANFCGISLGGMVGMWLGMNAGARIDRLVICNTSSDLRPPDLWQDRIDTVMSHGMEAIITGALERFLSESFQKSGSAKIDLIKSMIRSCDVSGYSGCCAAVRDMNLTSNLSRIKNSTLIIAGELDPSTPVAHSQLINQNIVGSSMKVIDGVAHLSNLEKPEEFNKDVLSFLLK